MINTTGYNIIFAKAGVSCFYDSLVQGSSAVFQLKFFGENSPLRQAENVIYNSICVTVIKPLQSNR